MEEYLLKKKKKKKRHREDEQRSKRLRTSDKEIQTDDCSLSPNDKTVLANIKDENVGLNEGPGSHFLSHHDHFIRSSCLKTSSCFSRLIHEEVQPNGGASVLHAYADEISLLQPGEKERFAREFLDLAFSEISKGAARYALSVVHGAAAYLPDFLDYFAFNFPNTPVKMEILGKKDIETTTISKFHSQVRGKIILFFLLWLILCCAIICETSPLDHILFFFFLGCNSFKCTTQRCSACIQFLCIEWNNTHAEKTFRRLDAEHLVL